MPELPCQALPYTAAGKYSQTVRMTTFGNRFRDARLHKGMTQDELADRLGITKSAISAWENDRETPAFDKLVAIRKELEVSIDELAIGEVGQPLRAQESIASYLPPRDMPRSPEERAMLRKFRELGNQKQRALLALLR